MLGVLVMCLFLFFGLGISWSLFIRRDILTKVWLGGSVGFAMMMWFPSLFAYAMKFTLAAQWWAVALAALCCAAAVAYRLIRPSADPSLGEGFPWKLAILLVAPMLIVSGYLQHTHTLRDVGGALHVGQSTYGDLPIHLGFATGLRNASFPPEYTLLPGARLGYPFLMDALSSTMLMFGSSLRQAFIIPGTLMTGLVFLGFLLLAYRVTGSKRAAGLALILLQFNGGLGFIYTLDRVITDPSRLTDVFTGFYLTPTNMPDLNLRWSNIIADMILPQRTLLAGWLMGLPAIWLFNEAIREPKRKSYFLMLGLWVGLIPMVNTHTFLAIGLMSIAAMIYRLIVEKKEARMRVFTSFCLYGAIAIAIAIPQLIAYTFPQATGQSALSFHFGWLNNSNGKLIDEYFWFWVKNVGLAYIMIFPAFRHADRQQKTLAYGALLIYIVADLVIFQRTEYDNNKLFYVAFILTLPLITNYLVALFDRLRGFQGRYLFAALFIAASTVSGGLSISREVVSDYELFSKDAVAAAEFVEKNTEPDAIFLTGTQHQNPVAALAGRKLVCGAPMYLYSHSIDYSEQYNALHEIYESPWEHRDKLITYQVDYAYISDYERGDFRVDEDFFANNYPLIFESGDISVYAISTRARERFQ